MGFRENGYKGQVRVLAFIRPDCPVCRRHARVLEEISKKYPVTTIDIFAQKIEAGQAGVTDAPTYVVVVDDVEVHRTNNIQDLL